MQSAGKESAEFWVLRGKRRKLASWQWAVGRREREVLRFECWELRGKRRELASWQWAVGRREREVLRFECWELRGKRRELAVGRQEKEPLRAFIISKTSWAYLKRIVLLRFLCLREEMGIRRTTITKTLQKSWKNPHKNKSTNKYEWCIMLQINTI